MKKYYSIFDGEQGKFLSTALNSTNTDDLFKQFADFYFIDDEGMRSDWDELSDKEGFMQSIGYHIYTTNEPVASSIWSEIQFCNGR